MDFTGLEAVFIRSLLALCAVVAGVALTAGILIGWWLA